MTSGEKTPFREIANSTPTIWHSKITFSLASAMVPDISWKTWSTWNFAGQDIKSILEL